MRIIKKLHEKETICHCKYVLKKRIRGHYKAPYNYSGISYNNIHCSVCRYTVLDVSLKKPCDTLVYISSQYSRYVAYF